MIIRLDLHDNDFSSDLIDFCSDLTSRMFEHDEPFPVRRRYRNEFEYLNATDAWFKEKDRLRLLRNRLLPPDHRFKKGSEEQTLIINEVLRLWKVFAEENDMERHTPDVSIQYSLEEKWENGQAVYYWTAHNTYICQ